MLLIALQYASGEFHWLSMRWHFLLGYATLALVLFRVVWGFVGSQSARFGAFVRGPLALMHYTGYALRGHVAAAPGHNPLGGWSVLALLASVGAQAASGLFASDDIDEFGPLTGHVSDAFVRRMTALHAWNRYALLGLIALHVIAVIVHLLRGENLVAAMWHGQRELEDDPRLRFVSIGRAVLVFAVCASLIAVVVALG